MPENNYQEEEDEESSSSSSSSALTPLESISVTCPSCNHDFEIPITESFREIPGLKTWSFIEGDYSPAIHELEYLSDRAAALVAVSLLENRINTVLKSRLRDDEKQYRELFRDGGPIGAFGLKIQLAYLLQMFSKEGLQDLSLIATIRNHFAHRMIAMTFEEPKIRDWCLKIKTVEQFVFDPSKRLGHELPVFGIAIEGARRVLSDPRNRFFLAVNQFSMAMERDDLPYF